MRLWKSFAKWVTCSAMLLACGVSAFASVGCADETFVCCQCKFLRPPECTPVDPAVVSTDFTLCACDSYTYEECGKLCKETIATQLLLDPNSVGATASPPFTCTPPKVPPMPPPPLQEPQLSLAVDVCPALAATTPPPPPP
jgi:hypothetical protein